MNQKKIIRLNLMFIFLLLKTIGFSQENNLDSLMKKIKTIYPQQIDSSFTLVKKGLPIALEHGDSISKTFFLDITGEIYRIKGNYDSAVVLLTQSLNLKTNWTDLKDLSLTHNDLGRTYVNMGDYDNAAFHFIEALKLMEESGNLLGQSFYLNNLGVVFDLQQNYEKSIYYYKKSLTIKEELKDSNAIAAVNLNLGILHSSINDYEHALDYLIVANDLYKNHPNKDKFIRAKINLLSCYIALENKSKAELLKKSIVEDLDEISETKLEAKTYYTLAKYYLFTEQLDEALVNLEKSLELSLSINALQNIKECYELKANIYEANHEFEKAIFCLKQVNTYKDSLIDDQSIAMISKMESKYRHEKNERLIKEQELSILKKESEFNEKMHAKKMLNLIFVFIICILTAVAFILTILYNSKRKKNQLTTAQNLLINKHNVDLKNMNNAISSELDRLKLTLEEKNKVLENVLEQGMKKELPDELLALSKREMEVLCYLSLGYSDDELAKKMFVSKSTIKTHLRNIYKKLLVKGRTEAIVIAHKHGIIGLD